MATLPTYANVFREVYGGPLPLPPPQPAAAEPVQRPDCASCNHPNGCRVRCEWGVT